LLLWLILNIDQFPRQRLHRHGGAKYASGCPSSGSGPPRNGMAE
jgi:hypothetical protein